jgi:hypothetical protein
VNEDIIKKCYQKLVLRKAGLELKELVPYLQLSEVETVEIIKILEAQNLVEFEGPVIKAKPWWDEEHVEICLNIPRISSDAFNSYCKEIDQFNEILRSNGYSSIRPYLHETTIEIVLGAAAAIVSIEFLKSFVRELGKHLAGFVKNVLTKYKDKGINEVEITISKKSITGDTFFITVRGTDYEGVETRIKALLNELVSSTNDSLSEEKIDLCGDQWRVYFEKKDGNNLV